MNKYIKVFFISLILLCFCNSLSFAQVNGGNYGTVVGPATTGVGQQLSSDGFHPPRTRMEEVVRRKAIRLSLSFDELRIYNRKEKGLELTFWEKMRYPFIKRKKKKADAITKKAESAQASSSQQTVDASSQPGYMAKAEKYQLTIKEKELIKQMEVDSTELSKEDLKTYKKAKKKQKKLDKYKAKYQVDKLSQDEEELLKMSRVQPDSLTKEQKKEVKQIKKKQKKSKKNDAKIRSYQVDSLYLRGVPVAAKPSFKYRIKSSLPHFSRKKRPSSYIKKQRRINRKYSPTAKQQDAYNKKKSGVWLSPLNNYRANRTATKLYLKDKKTDELLKKEFLKIQTKSTRKQMKERERKTNKNQRKRNNHSLIQKFLNIFKKRK